MNRLPFTQPQVVAHRGASGYRPEHTTAAYRLALALGADGIEVDLVATKDGVLVARHEPELSVTTDVSRHLEFSDRRTTRVVDGRGVTGWFVDDFTLAELKTLRALERWPSLRRDNLRYDRKFAVPTFAEVLQLAEEEGHRLGRTVTVYAELKHPTWFAASGLRLEELLLDTLNRQAPLVPVVVLAFETTVLRRLRLLQGGSSLPLVQLIEAGGMPYDRGLAGDLWTYRGMITPAGLVQVGEYADAVGLAKNLVLPRDERGATGRPGPVVGDAHALGLDVLVWTLRDENDFLPTNHRHGADPAKRGDAVAEWLALLGAGCDVLVGDHPDSGVEAAKVWRRSAALSSSGMRTQAAT